MDTERMNNARKNGWLPRHNLPDNKKFQFGKYKGQLIGDVAKFDLKYLKWLIEGEAICSGCKKCLNGILEIPPEEMDDAHTIRNLISSEYVGYLYDIVKLRQHMKLMGLPSSISVK